jgi:SAM-dependent methyltransferase
MNEKSSFPRYDHPILAWEYDQRQPTPLSGELEWYLKYTALSCNSALELTCGSGRLTIPLALAGVQVDGVDRSKTMLKRLKDKINTYDETIKQRVRVFCADIIDFTPEKKFDCVLFPYNSLQYLETVQNVSLYFCRVAMFLNSGGYFLFAIRRFDPSQYIDGHQVVIDWMNEPLVNSETGESIGSKFVSFWDKIAKQLINERTYRIIHSNGFIEHITQVTYSPIIEVTEYIGMLEKAGFNVQVFSSYDESEEDGKSRELCFVSRKR